MASRVSFVESNSFFFIGIALNWSLQNQYIAPSFVHECLGSYLAHPTATSSMINWLTKCHLSAYCKTLCTLNQIHRPLLGFESLCLSPEVPRHTLSAIYKRVLAHNQSTPPTFTKLWSRELRFEVSTGGFLLYSSEK